jgi:hypothetical protein
LKKQRKEPLIQGNNQDYCNHGWKIETSYLTLRSVLSSNNPQNSEMKFGEKIEVDMLKIIITIIGYILNNFTTHITILYIVDDGKNNSSVFCQCGN